MRVALEHAQLPVPGDRRHLDHVQPALEEARNRLVPQIVETQPLDASTAPRPLFAGQSHAVVAGSGDLTGQPVTTACRISFNRVAERHHLVFEAGWSVPIAFVEALAHHHDLSMLAAIMTNISKPRKSSLATLGEYWLETVSNSPNLYIAWYDERTRQVRRRTTRTAILQEAERKLAHFVTVNGKLRDAGTDEVLLSQLLIRYYEQHAKHLASADEAFRSCGFWLYHFDDIPVSDITADAQDNFQRWMIEEKGWSVGYANRVISVGRAAFRRAYKRGEIKMPPFIFDIDSAKYGKKRQRTRRLSIDELARLIDAIPERTPHIRLFVLLMVNTLSRPEAIFELHHSQLDFYDGLIHLNPEGREQTKKHRPIVPMTETIKPWLREVPEGHYCVEWAGRRITTVEGTWRNLRDWGNLDKQVIPYTLRHTMATALRRAGVPPLEISAMLGHTVPEWKTTAIYAAYDPSYLQEARQAIDAFMLDLQKRCETPVVHREDGHLLSSCFQAHRDTLVRRQRDKGENVQAG